MVSFKYAVSPDKGGSHFLRTVSFHVLITKSFEATFGFNGDVSMILIKPCDKRGLLAYNEL